MSQPPVPSHYFVGLDLGQAADYTAIVVAERIGTPPHRPSGGSRFYDGGQLIRGVVPQAPRKAAEPFVYHLRHLERPRLGTPYPAIVERVKAILDEPTLKGRVQLVVDATGVGKPVVDLLRAAKLGPVAVTITGGDNVSFEAGGYRVPKRDLVGALQVLLQTERFKVAEGLTEAAVLVQELLNFKAKISLTTGHDSYEAWRTGTHDDLVLAAALACWWGERWAPPKEPVGSQSWYSW